MNLRFKCTDSERQLRSQTEEEIKTLSNFHKVFAIHNIQSETLSSTPADSAMGNAIIDTNFTSP
jgi:hypothetical protein